MQENWDKSFEMVLAHEGGFVNHPKDPGGMTNLGVTKAAWEGYVGKPVDETFMRAPDPIHRQALLQDHVLGQDQG